jgi:aryl-alcohol dehydrogenase-like predicted oxidoreductase
MKNRREFLAASALLGGGILLGGATAPKSGTQRVLGTGKAALKVSALGLGCMGMSYHRSFVPDKQASLRLLREAYAQGVTFFDTAEAYGPLLNEKLVGEGIKDFRKEIVLATKFGFKEGKPSLGLDSRPARIRAVVENSLKSLRTDYIDLLYQHRVDPQVPIEEVAGTVQDLIKAGKVKYFGLSEASASVIRRAHKVQAVTALQSEYSLMTRQPEEDVLGVCEELGIGFVPYSPLSRGMITGYLNERSKYNAANDNRPSLPRYQGPNVIANWPLIEALKDFGDQRGLTVAQVALAWLLAQKPWIVPIPGTTKKAHLVENFGAGEVEVSLGEWKVLTDKINTIKIVGERYTGVSAEQTKKD